MPDLYIYNATNKFFDTTSSMNDLLLQSGVLIPPGSQAHVTLPDAPTYNSVVAQLGNYGVVDHATVTSPATFSGTSSAAKPITNVGKPVPIITAPVVAPPKGK
jgi:hypothetical protein